MIIGYINISKNKKRKQKKIKTKREYDKVENDLWKLENNIQMTIEVRIPEGKENIEDSLVSTSKALMGLELLETATLATILKETQDKLRPIYTKK